MFDFGYPNWGENPPFHAPVFVVTHRGQERISESGGTSYTFVTGGVAAVVEQARAVADGKDVLVAGGVSIAQQALADGLVTRSCCMSCRSWWGGEFGCSTLGRWVCAASRPSRAKARSTSAMKCGDRWRPRAMPGNQPLAGLFTGRACVACLPGGVSRTPGLVS